MDGRSTLVSTQRYIFFLLQNRYEYVVKTCRVHVATFDLASFLANNENASSIRKRLKRKLLRKVICLCSPINVPTTVK